ncbi:MAG TPA: NAD-dependent deacylase [Phycisphaerae bacterium]|jgi:NAD-dependent deacetylase|nr:NAD-dependent deacylase [Phycisphaerae bacterium]HQL53741.1 NAD-dependent deacylase [Phycisphaerae bacterium]
MDDNALNQAARLLITAKSVCVSTGAGMSVESGLDTFRGEDGLWSKVNIEDMATPDAFRRDPVKVWAWYRWRRQKLAEIEPHDGHRVLAEWEQEIPDFTLVTQNIDGLHHRAGSKNVIELHGRLDVARCTYCDYTVQTLDDLGEDPYCPLCHKRLRPGVVWFNEALPPGAIELAFAAAQRCDVFLVIGTSGVVQPAASLADAAKAYGARVIEVNPNPSELSYLADVCVRAGCRAALTGIDAAWRRIAS